MAIIIPSKNIYQIQNPKVRDNVIERVEVSESEVTPVEKYNTSVFSTDTDTSSLYDFKATVGQDILPFFSQNGGEYSFSTYSYYSVFYYLAGNAIGAKPYYKTINVSIPKNNGTRYIKDIFYGLAEGKNNIKSTITYNYYASTLSGEVKKNENIEDKDNTQSYARYSLSKIIHFGFDKKGQKQSDLLSFAKSRSFKTVESAETAPTLIAQLSLSDQTNISTAKIEYNETDDCYNVSLTILCGFVQWQVVFCDTSTLKKDEENRFFVSGNFIGFSDKFPDVLNDQSGYGGVSRGRLEIFEPLRLLLTFNGDTFELDIKENTLILGNATGKKVHSVDGNELMQTSNYWLPTGEKAIERAFEKTLIDYEKGKETAVLRCSISDYYTSDGEKAISIDDENGRMMFKEYDIVKPMVYSVSGVDVPMSLDKYGNAKIFKILGVKPYYNGAVWQELHLQESEEKSYRIKVSSTFENGDNKYRCRFDIKGKGNVYVNEKLYVSINNETDNSITIETEKKEIMDIMFLGSFSKISFDYDAEPNTYYPAPVGKLLSVLDWGYLIKTYIGMFSYQDLEDTWFSISPQIKTISKETFKCVDASSLKIPKTISKIDDYAFYFSRINKITFLHGENDTIVLPTAGSGTGMFYSKFARDMDIYTDNPTIKNYDWTTDNITATILHLDGKEWTE